jgi:tetratricopeptide (TPR) repeat protein
MPARWLYPLLLAACTIIAYSDAAPPAFVYDDAAIIGQDPNPGGVSRISHLFLEGARAGTAGNPRLYRPLAMATLALDRALYGEDPRGYHVTNILLHTLATLALFGAIGALGVDPLAAFLAALTFGVHPIHTEVVDVAYNRSEILATLAVVGALWWLALWIDRSVRWAFVGAALFYFAGLLSRESASTLPALAVLTLALLRPPATKGRRSILVAGLVATAVPLLLYLWLRQAALGEPGGGIGRSLANGILGTDSVAGRLAQVAVTVRDYWRMIVWPWPLRASHEDYVVRNVALALSLHAALAAAALASLRRAPALALGIAFFYVALLPSTRLFGDPAVLAERFVYLPSAGLAVAFAFALAALVRRYGARSVTVVALTLAVALTLVTLRRNLDWHSRRALWEAEARWTQDDWKVLLNLSEVYVQQGRHQEAVALCDRGLKLAPTQSAFAANRGIGLASLGRLDEAEASFQRAIALSGGAPLERANLARLYAMTGRAALAEEQYSKAITREENEAVRHALRGEMLLYCRSDRASAAAEFQAALALAPRLRQAQQGLRLAQGQSAGAAH